MMHTTVLIVGAGPTGLMMASQLSILRIPFIIVEKESGPTRESRALGIQARTLEIFYQMGIVDTFLDQGKRAEGFNFVTNGTVAEHIPLAHLGNRLTKFPYLLILEQARTEEIMIDFLKSHEHSIHWNTEVLSFTQNTEKVEAVLKHQNGKEEKIVADWIIGADGAHSVVRHNLGIKLKGKTYKQSLFVLDCKILSTLPENEISVAFSDTAFAAFFPMTRNRWRIVGEIPEKAYGKDDLTFEDVEKEFAKQMKMDITLSDPNWISFYHSHHRCVETFQKGRAFLLGDAAHIHSPIAAQGMNTGLQDAYNLAWKLAFVIRKDAKLSLLDTYTSERLPFARRLVNTTDRIFNLLLSTNPLAIFTRFRIIPALIAQIVAHKKSGEIAFGIISQTGINYRHEPFTHNASFGTFPKEAPQPGDRLPFILFGESNQRNIQEMVSPVKMHLFIFPGKKDLLNSVLQAVEPFKKSIGITEIPLTDNTKDLYKQLGIKSSGYYLVRPDIYIAYRCNLDKTTHFKQYLSSFLNKE